MKHSIYLILDCKARSCVGTFMSLTDETAQRSFEDLLFNWQPSVYNEHPEDFSLYKLCDFVVDDQNCSVNLLPSTLKLIVQGSNFSRSFIDNERIKRRVRFEEIVDQKYRDIVKREEVSRET